LLFIPYPYLTKLNPPFPKGKEFTQFGFDSFLFGKGGKLRGINIIIQEL